MAKDFQQDDSEGKGAFHKPDVVSLIPRTHMMGEKQGLQVLL